MYIYMQMHIYHYTVAAPSKTVSYSLPRAHKGAACPAPPLPGQPILSLLHSP